MKMEFLSKSSFYLFLIFYGLSSGILGPILPLYFRSIGISIVEWSFLVSLFAVGLTASEIVWGVLSDRVGRKIILGLTPLILSFIIPFYTLTAIFPVFAILQVARGSIFSAPLPTSKAYVSDKVLVSKLGAAMGLLMASTNSGRIVGSILGPYLVNNGSYFNAFYFSAISSFISSVIVFTLLTETKQHKTRNKLPFKKIFRSVFHRKQVFIIFGLGILGTIGKATIQTFLPLFAIELFNASAVDVGWLLSVFTLSLVLTTFLSGLISDKMGKKPAILIGFILVLFSYLSFLLIDKVSLAFLSTIGVAAGFAFIFPSILALLTDLVGSEVYGSAMGIYGTFEDFGIIIAPLLFGFAWTIYGPYSIFYGSALIQVLGVALILLVKK